MPALEAIYLILSVGIMIIFVVIAIFMLFIMFRALRTPRGYYPPRPPARELTKDLMCPKCGAKELEPTGYYTIHCRICGFMFSVGGERPYAYYLGWWFWPMFGWWAFAWIWPLVWFKRE